MHFRVQGKMKPVLGDHHGALKDLNKVNFLESKALKVFNKANILELNLDSTSNAKNSSYSYILKFKYELVLFSNKTDLDSSQNK
jgi:hypothetical protein